MELSLKQVRAIVGVGDHASLARASDDLGISQSSLSRQVAEAEAALGHRLFQRGWNGTEPTSSGAVVLTHSRRMLALIRDVETRLRADGVRCSDLSYHLTWTVLDMIDAVLMSGSASGAAQSLGVSQPTVSRTLALASSALGRPPFIRKAGGMIATPAGGALGDLRDALRAETRLLRQSLDALAGAVTGRVAVGLLPFSEHGLVVTAFSRLLVDYPHVRLQAVSGSYSALVEALRRGDIDFILGPLRGATLPEGLEETPLFSEWITVVARHGHPLGASPTDLAELVGYPWVIGPHGTPTRQAFESLLESSGLTSAVQVCEMVTFPLAEQMVAESDAIGMLTYSERRREHPDPRLRTIKVDLPSRERSIGLTFPRGRRAVLPQKLFVERLQHAWNSVSSEAIA